MKSFAGAVAKPTAPPNARDETKRPVSPRWQAKFSPAQFPRAVGLRDSLVGRFVAHGISQDRIIRVGSTERRDHLLAHGNIDISLDPFPQNGGVSTWESLYMGVPVVAKLGKGASSRAAGAILKAIGL